MVHVLCPVVRPVASIVRCVKLGPKAEQQLYALNPAFIGCSVQRRVSCCLNFVDVFSCFQKPLDLCKQRTIRVKFEVSSEWQVSKYPSNFFPAMRLLVTPNG